LLITGVLGGTTNELKPYSRPCTLTTSLPQPNIPCINLKKFKMKIILSLFFTLTTLICHAQDDSIKKEKWHWDNPSGQDTSAGYVQVLKVDNILYISGAVTSEVTPKGIQQVYQALEKSLKSFGATFQNVVKENLN
jgi:hypothetical protein